MKKILFATAATSALFFAACGGDTSSGADDSSSKVASPSTSQAALESASLSVDESNHILVVTNKKVTEGFCVIDENENFSWKTLKINGGVDSSKYEFLGDTLILYDFYDGEQSEIGEMMVGGTSGNIYGTWTYTGCYFDPQRMRTECEDDEATSQYTRTVTYSKGSATTQLDFHLDTHANDDFTDSRFMISLYFNLSGGIHAMAGEQIFDQGDLQEVIEAGNITIKEKSKNKEIFELGDKTYTVNVKKADMFVQTTGYDAGLVNYDVVVEVSDGSTVCNYDYKILSMDVSLCSTSNAEYFEEFDDVEDVNGNRYDVTFAYAKSTISDFRDCMKQIETTSPLSSRGSGSGRFDADYARTLTHKKHVK